MPLHSERSNCCRTPYFFRLVKSPIHFFRSLLTKSANFCIFETYLFGDIVSNLFFYSLTHLLFQLSMRKSISKYPIYLSGKDYCHFSVKEPLIRTVSLCNRSCVGRGVLPCRLLQMISVVLDMKRLIQVLDMHRKRRAVYRLLISNVLSNTVCVTSGDINRKEE